MMRQEYQGFFHCYISMARRIAVISVAIVAIVAFTLFANLWSGSPGMECLDDVLSSSRFSTLDNLLRCWSIRSSIAIERTKKVFRLFRVSTITLDICILPHSFIAWYFFGFSELRADLTSALGVDEEQESCLQSAVAFGRRISSSADYMPALC